MIILPYHQNYNLRLQRTIWINFLNVFPFFSTLSRLEKKSFRLWCKLFGSVVKTELYAYRGLFWEITKFSHFFLSFGPRASTFQILIKLFRPSCQNPNLHKQKSIPERNKIFHQNIIFHIIFGLRADIFSTFDKLFPALLKILVFTSPAHQFDVLQNDSGSSIHFVIWSKSTWIFSAKFLAQLLKLTSSRTQEQFEKQQVCSIENNYSRFFGPRVPLFRMFGNNSGTVVKTVSRSEQEIWTFRAKFSARLLDLHSTWTDEHFDDEEISQTNLNFSFFWHFERHFSGILWKRHPEEHLEWNFFLKVLNLFFSSSDLHRRMFWLLENSFLHCCKTAFTFPKHHFHNSCEQDPTF